MVGPAEGSQQGESKARPGQRRIALWTRDYARLPGIPDEYIGQDGAPRAVWSRFFDAFAAMAPGALFIDHTTVSAEIARRLASEGAARGLHVVDAPVSGGQADHRHRLPGAQADAVEHRPRGRRIAVAVVVQEHADRPLQPRVADLIAERQRCLSRRGGSALHEGNFAERRARRHLGRGAEAARDDLATVEPRAGAAHRQGRGHGALAQAR